MQRSTTNGWAVFAATMLLVVGGMNLIQGFFGMFFANHYIAEGGRAVVFNFTLWGIGLAIFGAVLALAGLALATKQFWVRTAAVVLAAVNILVQFVFLVALPLWSVIAIVLSTVAVYAMTAGWSTGMRMDEEAEEAQERGAYGAGRSDAMRQGQAGATAVPQQGQDPMAQASPGRQSQEQTGSGQRRGRHEQQR